MLSDLWHKFYDGMRNSRLASAKQDIYDHWCPNVLEAGSAKGLIII